MKGSQVIDAASHWKQTGTSPQFPSLDRNLETDVVVIGGGFTRITAAWLLKNSGAKIVLLERQRCAGQIQFAVKGSRFITHTKKHPNVKKSRYVPNVTMNVPDAA